jgi:hypothetical protein
VAIPAVVPVVIVPIGPGMESYGSEVHPATQVSAIRQAALNIIDPVQVNEAFLAVFPIHSTIQFWVVADVDV